MVHSTSRFWAEIFLDAGGLAEDSNCEVVNGVDRKYIQTYLATAGSVDSPEQES